jgi:hypothetical protein
VPLNGSAIICLGFVALCGVLVLGAHQLDEAGHRKRALALLVGGIVALVAAVLGPYVIVVLLFIGLLYVVALGLPIAGIILIVRRIRHRGA